MRWIFDTSTKNYTSDEGDAVDEGDAQDLRDAFIDDQKSWADTLAQALVNGHMSLKQWSSSMASRITTMYTALYALGKGGLDTMRGEKDQQPATNLINEQLQYLDNFAHDIKAGTLSEQQIEARSELYFESARQAFHEGRADSWEIDLPAKPGDGQTQCLTNCRCRWEIVETDEAIEATWVVDPDAEHCDDCLNNADLYNPLVFPKPATD
jgi:hypothetical protein